MDWKDYTNYQLQEYTKFGGFLIELVAQLSFKPEINKVGRPKASLRNIIICCALKRKFGQEIMSKNAISQYNEALLKVICHNITQLIRASMTEKVKLKD